MPRHRLLALAFVAFTACTEDPGPTADAAAATDTKTDAAGAELPGVATVVCPGGGGCECVQDGECESGRCLESADTTKACAIRCAGGTCASPAAACRLVDGFALCVPKAGRTCDPCTASSQCASPGHGGAACVSQGPAGAFCGVACLGDADCSGGFRCGSVTRVEGGQTQQCVPVAADGLAFGVCTCSARAIAASLATTCKADLCSGKRSCGADGLGACTAPAPAAETCNGKDDDCDGLTDEIPCSDGNPCTTDACDPAKATTETAGCTFTPTTAACSDGDACTGGDTCADGKCAAGKALACDDKNPCTDEACDPKAGCVTTVMTGKACDADANPCTQDDACDSHVCKAGNLLLCDDKSPCTADACDPKTGACASNPHDGAGCDDGDACTDFDLCKAGACAGSAAVCNDGNPCTDDACVAKKGCEFKAKAGGACDDGNGCTVGDACASGVCGGGSVKACAGASTCQDATCNPTNGQCILKAKKAGTACSDGSACTTSDQCQAGTCKGTPLACDDAKPCTDDACDAKTGCTNVENTAPCDDGDACTSGDKCGLGECSGKALAPAACDDGKVCTTDGCDPKVGCGHVNKVGACDDGNACTAGDACAGDVCKSGTNSCPCKNKGDCVAKEDGDPCNGTLDCSNDQCQVDLATIVKCVDTTGCATSACDPTSGKCKATPVGDGKACNDGSGCTTDDSCKAGTCAGKAADCDDKNGCTDDTCSGNGTCNHAANTAACDSDGNGCTVDACSAKVCAPGPKKSCDDGNVCTTDSCEPKDGACTTKPAAGVCDDGNACSVKDACDAGVCKSEAAPVTTALVAGSGSPGWADGKGAQAKFQLPRGIAVGTDGVAYVADSANQRIRKVATDGTVTTLAGKGTQGFADGAGSAAVFWGPEGVAVAADGTVYVADTLNQRIRKVSATGVVTTLAGDAPEPDIDDTKAAGAYKDGKGAAARFDEPSGIAVAADGVVYVADAANHRIRAIAVDGTVTTLAGSGVGNFADGKGNAASFFGPRALALGTGGVLYVADTGNHRIRQVTADGTVTTVAGKGTAGIANGIAAEATFNAPRGVAVDGGTVFVVDSEGHTLRQVANGQVTTLAGTGEAGYFEGAPTAAKWNTPSGVAFVSAGKWLVADALNHRLRQFTDPGKACVK